MVTTSMGLIPPPIYKRRPPTKKKTHLRFILKGSRNISCAGSLPSTQTASSPANCSTCWPSSSSWTGQFVSVPASIMHIFYVIVRATTSNKNFTIPHKVQPQPSSWGDLQAPGGRRRRDRRCFHLSSCACAVFHWVNTRLTCSDHKSMNKSWLTHQILLLL